jgi:hypothetical protein
VKKPVINVDNLKDDGDGTIPSPVTDLVASMFAVQNVANVLVTESASIRGTFIWFHEHIATSLDRMTEVLMKEQVAAQRGRLVSFKLLEWIVEVLERSSPRQAGVIPMEGPAAEVVPVIVADVEWAQTLLFLMDSDLMDLPFALEASKNSKEESGNCSRSEGSGSEDDDDGSFRAMDGDAMVE